jgi:hypothetical protein
MKQGNRTQHSAHWHNPIEEASSLFNQMRIGLDREAHAAAREVVVSIIPRVQQDATFAMMISCFCLTHRSAAWQGFPVRLISEADEYLARLNNNGYAYITGLPVEDYRIATTSVWGSSRDPVKASIPVQEELGKLAAAPLLSEPKPALPPEEVFTDKEGRLLASIQTDERGETEVRFETADAALINKTVTFGFYSLGEVSQALLTAQVILRAVAGSEGRCEALWRDSVKFQVPTHFYFWLDDPPSQPTVSWLAAGIEWVSRGLESFMRVTLEGLEDLHRAYVPSRMRSEDMGLRGALEQAQVPVVVLSLNPEENGVKLAVRWLGRIPESPPTVSVTLKGKPVHAPSYEWLNWDGRLDRTQGLLIHECPLEPRSLQAAAGPVLAYRWEAEKSHLHIDLLPPADDE